MYAISTATFVSILALASSLAVVVQAVPAPAADQPAVNQPAVNQPAVAQPATTPAVTTQQPQCVDADKYDVQAGDTCAAIAKKFNLAPAAIVELNSGTLAKCDDTPLPAPEKLCLGKAVARRTPAQPVCQKSVKPTGTGVDAALASQLNIALSEVCPLLRKYNADVGPNCDNLVPGQAYCLD